ncbi:MAG TPA: hypothetical protein VEQ65_01185, partial [Opitutus sp.]|nr:hypothetical protein [Opitutus sp.]
EEGFLLASMGVLLGVAVLCFGLGLRQGTRAHFAGVHEFVGIVAVCVALYVLGFTWSAQSWASHTLHAARWQPIAVALALAMTAAAWAATRNRAELKPLGGCLLIATVPALAHLLGLELGDSGWLWGGVASIALFLVNLGMIRTGLRSGRESWINLGIAFIALNVVTRYFLLFGSMLDGGVFFIVTGLLILGLGYYLERKRRELLATLREEGAS